MPRSSTWWWTGWQQPYAARDFFSVSLPDPVLGHAVEWCVWEHGGHVGALVVRYSSPRLCGWLAPTTWSVTSSSGAKVQGTASPTIQQAGLKPFMFQAHARKAGLAFVRRML